MCVKERNHHRNQLQRFRQLLFRYPKIEKSCKIVKKNVGFPKIFLYFCIVLNMICFNRCEVEEQ